MRPDCAVVPDLLGEAAPSFGSGAGVGRGMGSALAAHPSETMPNTATPTNSPWPVPAMVPLRVRPSVPAGCGEKTTAPQKAQQPLRKFSITLGGILADQ